MLLSSEALGEVPWQRREFRDSLAVPESARKLNRSEGGTVMVGMKDKLMVLRATRQDTTVLKGTQKQDPMWDRGWVVSRLHMRGVLPKGILGMVLYLHTRWGQSR